MSEQPATATTDETHSSRDYDTYTRPVAAFIGGVLAVLLLLYMLPGGGVDLRPMTIAIAGVVAGVVLAFAALARWLHDQAAGRVA